MVKGLEFLSRRDGAWYDVDLSTTRIVEWQENLYLRVCLRGFPPDEDEFVAWDILLRNEIFRETSKIVAAGSIGTLKPGNHVSGLGKSKTTSAVAWFDGIVKKCSKGTGGDTVVTMEWKQGNGWESFGTPLTNKLSLKRREVCVPGSQNVLRHPFLAKWRSMVREIVNLYGKKYNHTLDLSLKEVMLEGDLEEKKSFMKSPEAKALPIALTHSKSSRKQAAPKRCHGGTASLNPHRATKAIKVESKEQAAPGRNQSSSVIDLCEMPQELFEGPQIEQINCTVMKKRCPKISFYAPKAISIRELFYRWNAEEDCISIDVNH